MTIRPVRTDDDYEAALAEIERLWGYERGTAENDTLEVLTTLVEAYEASHHSIPDADPIDVLASLIDSGAITRKELEPCIGSRARVSEVLSRQRRLSMTMVRRLNERLAIPSEVLIREYALADRRRASRRERDATAPAP